jgi:hypothetical protein
MPQNVFYLSKTEATRIPAFLTPLALALLLNFLLLAKNFKVKLNRTSTAFNYSFFVTSFTV